jgi:hypothetical protein
MAYQDVVWKHVKTGGLYRIEGFALEEATLTPVVVYRKRDTAGSLGAMFTRPCTEFFDGRFRVDLNLGVE